MAVKKDKLGNEAAKSTTAVNTLVGFRRSEVVKSLGIMAGYAAKQPKPFAKHLKNYASEMLGIVKAHPNLPQINVTDVSKTIHGLKTRFINAECKAGSLCVMS